MINFQECPFYRDPDWVHIGKGLGYCDLAGGDALCEGDIRFCDKPDDLENHLLGSRKEKGEKDREDTLKKKSFSYRVLVVDDEEPIRSLIISLLSISGHQCEKAQDGFEALEKIKGRIFDAVVTDIVMPGMDGIKLIKRLLKLYPKLPIMVMTGFSKEYPVEVAMEAGAREFIAKPFSNEEFILRFNKMMNEHQRLLHSEEKQKELFLQVKREALVKINEMKKELDTLYLKIRRNEKFV